MKLRMRSFTRSLLIDRKKTRNQGLIFVISLFMASVFWFLVNLNKTYQTHISLPAKIEEIPEDVQIIPFVFPDIVVNVQGMGGMLMSHILNFQRDTLRITYDSELQEGYLLTQAYNNTLRNTVKGLDLMSIQSPDSLRFEVQKKVSKKVPIRPRITVQLASAHLLEDEPELYPDSIRIVGPERILDTIRSWPTQAVETPRLKSERVLPVSLVDTVPQLLIEPKTVYYQVKPKLYTQSVLTIPIEISGIPEGFDVKWNHHELTVSCLVPMDYYEKAISESQPYVIPFEHLTQDIPYVLPDLSYLPNQIKILYVEPSRLEFVIVEQYVKS